MANNDLIERFKGAQKVYNETLSEVEDSKDLTTSEKELVYNHIKQQVIHERITMDELRE